MLTSPETEHAQAAPRRTPAGATAPPVVRRPKERRHYWLVVVCVLVLASAAAAAWFRYRNTPRPVVETQNVVSGPLSLDWNATGYVAARTADLSTPQSARITAIAVREGDRVRRGQVVARLYAGELNAGEEGQAQAVHAARAEADAARAAVRQADATSADRVAQAEAAVEAAGLRVSQSNSVLARERRVNQAGVAAAAAEVDAAEQQLKALQAGPRRLEISQAEASLSDAEAVLRRAQIEEDRQRSLYAQKATARRAVEDAEEARSRARAQVDRAKASLDLLREGTRREEIAAAAARVAAAKERRSAAEAQLAGVQVLERDVEERQAARKQAQAALEEARSARMELEVLRARSIAADRRVAEAGAGLKGTKALLQERTLVSPFDGYVGRRAADPGDLAVPGQPLLTVVESEHSWIEAEADEQSLASVRMGQKVRITIPSHPGKVLPGRVVRIGAEAVPQIEQTRTSARIVRVRISLGLLSPGQRSLLKSGMEVDVGGQSVLAAKTVLAPNDAVRVDSTGPYVLLVDESHQIVRRRVITGYVSGRVTQVLTGLKAGERVIVSSAEGLEDGARVNVRSVP